MSAPEIKAVFLTAVSQDADAPGICKALRAAGVEVWFSRLRRAVVEDSGWPLAWRLANERVASLGVSLGFPPSPRLRGTSGVWSWTNSSAGREALP
jgi:hypothetical protein